MDASDAKAVMTDGGIVALSCQQYVVMSSRSKLTWYATSA